MFMLTACLDDLNTIPLDESVTTGATVYDNPEAYRQVLAKCYAGLATTGQQGPAGLGDLGGIDEGFSSYLRGYWNLQVLTTEEAVTGWGDDGLIDLPYQNWTSNNDFVKGFYYRVFYQLAIANELIREASDEKLNERNVPENQRSTIKMYRAEARFLRALSYWHALDLFRNIPFVTEDDGVGAFFPEQISPADLFDFLETELIELEEVLHEPRMNEYGRVDRASAWMLLAKLYLNAEVYIGTPRYNDAAIYSKKVIDAGYQLEGDYEHLFLADNDNADGIIFAIPFDGNNTRTWGATTFIINGAIGGTMVPSDYGVQENWGGHRATKELVYKFPQYQPENKSLVVPVKSTSNYPVLYCPGSYQGWDVANSNTVIYSRNSDNVYEGYLYFPDNDNEFKFALNASWDENYGTTDTEEDLGFEGGNINVEEAGLYRVIANLDDLTYSLTKTTWGVIGDATEGGWDSDQSMTLNEDGTLTAEIMLSEGSFKFRANNAWDLNLGTSETPGVLTYDGGNVPVTEPGRYLLTLYLTVPDYTFSVEAASSDTRALFYTSGQIIDIDLISDFSNGYAVTKWKNITSAGVPGVNPTHVDTDYPIFRLADAYLMYAEAALRGGGDTDLALQYVNRVRTRAYLGESGNITKGELTLQFILDERAREFYWEGYRRTDLVRYGLFTGEDYTWPWKGGVKEGRGTDRKFDIFPIPASDIIANPNLNQNANY